MMVEIKNLKKHYGDLKAVDGISLNIKGNIIYGLLGPNGAGKSTTISMISTLIKPTDGQIIVGGFDALKQPDKIRKILGLVPQDIALYPTLSAEDNLSFFGRMYGLGGNVLQKRVSEVLDIVGLLDRRKDAVGTFSGGMKRRINIGVGLINNPKLLILDEPTVGIDPQSRNHILETVKKLSTAGMTVIYTSHYMEEVEYLCSELAIVDKGNVIASGTKDEVKKLGGESEKILITATNLNSAIEDVKKLNFVKQALFKDGTISISVKNASEVLGDVISLLNSKKVKITSVKVEEQDLEGVFLNLTGRALRD